MQRRVGFELRALLADYLNDPVCDNYSVLIVLAAPKDVVGARRPAASQEAPRSITIWHGHHKTDGRHKWADSTVTQVPGPNSRAMLARRASAVASGLGRATDVVIERAEGALVFDVDGNTLHRLRRRHRHARGRPLAARRWSRRSQAQAAKFIHVCALVATYEPYVRLCETAQRDHARRRSEEDDPRQQRRRERRERRQAGAGVTPAVRRSSASRAAITAARC